MRRLLDGAFVVIEEIVPAVLLLALTGVIAYGVVMRYFLDSPVSWPNELATALFIWQLFLASAGAARHHMHLGVDAVVTLFPGRWRAAQELLVNLAILAVLLSFILLAWRFAENPTKVLQMINLSYTWIYLAVPVGFGLAAVHVVEDLLRAARGLVAGGYRPPMSAVQALVEMETEGVEQMVRR